LSNLDWNRLLQIGEMIGRDDFEADEVDRRDSSRFPFGDRDRDIDRILLVVELCVEARHTRIRISAIGVERLDPLHVGFKPRTIEVELAAPEKFPALPRRERTPQPRLLDRLHAVEFERANDDGAFFFTRAPQRRSENKEEN